MEKVRVVSEIHLTVSSVEEEFLPPYKREAVETNIKRELTEKKILTELFDEIREFFGGGEEVIVDGYYDTLKSEIIND